MTTKLEEALKAARDTRACIIGQGVLAELPKVFAEQFPEANGSALVIADPRTWAAAGSRVAEMLRAPSFLIEDQGLHAEMAFVDRVSQALAAHPGAVPVAVGSGTINDLTKLASGRANRPYLVVGTAASMDGYASYGASITYKNVKQTFDCPAPRAILADLDIIRRAPAAMTASGFADLLAKVVAGADWILADALGVDPIHPVAWHIVQDGLADALSDPAAARAGEVRALGKFVEGLMLGGFAMQAMRNSRCASGAEHYFSHLWDMQHHTFHGETPSHGFKVGVATHFVAGMYEKFMAEPLEKLDIAACCAKWLEWPEAEVRARRLYAGTEFPERGVEETRAKYIDRAALAIQLKTLKENCAAIKARLAKQLLSADEIARRLRLIGAPVDPEEIGISKARMRGSVIMAQHIRRRFTILDVALRIDALDRWTDAVLQ